MAPEFFPQRVLASEERSGHYGRASMCALRGKGQARARPAQSVAASPLNGANQWSEDKPLSLEPFAKFASRWDLLPGRVVIPGSAGVPPAQDLAGSWRLASQGWSVHLPTGAGAAPLQECGRDARAPRGKPMAGQVQIRILQKAHYAFSDLVRNAGYGRMAAAGPAPALSGDIGR